MKLYLLRADPGSKTRRSPDAFHSAAAFRIVPLRARGICVTQPPLANSACHCRGCQKRRGHGLVRQCAPDHAGGGWFYPFMETCTSTKLPFAETGAVRSFKRFPAMEECEGLVKAYQAWVG